VPEHAEPHRPSGAKRLSEKILKQYEHFRLLAVLAAMAFVLVLAIPGTEDPGDDPEPPVPEWPDPALCPADLPPAEELPAVLLIGSASGNSYYDDFRAQLIACGWAPADVAILDGAAHACMASDLAELTVRIEQTMADMGAERVALVGYSLGGIRARAYVALHGGWRNVDRVVLWGSPNGGLPYTAGAECWNDELHEDHPFIACVNAGPGADPTCVNPFAEAAGWTKAAAGAGDGVVYTNIYSDDVGCGFCVALCGECGPLDLACLNERCNPPSDGVVPGYSARLPGAQNVDIPGLEHWMFFEPVQRRDVMRISIRALAGLSVPEADDGDGVVAAEDNCPLHANADQADADGDGIGDACDLCPGEEGSDRDGDGVCGAVDLCPDTPDLAPVDTDKDGIGDSCDLCPYDVDAMPDDKGLCPSVAPDASATEILLEVIVRGRTNRHVGDAVVRLEAERA